MKYLDPKIQDRLTSLAYRRSTPYCLHCALESPAGRCPECFTDDLARILPAEGCDFGCDWIIRSLIRENLAPVNVEEAFEACIVDCYPETTKVAWLELDTISIAKEMDPLSWKMAIDEWVSERESEGELVSFDYGSSYFSVHDIEIFLDEAELEDCERDATQNWEELLRG